jgi:hypothetical protein
MHPSDRYRTGNLLKWRWSERSEVVATNGSTLHARMAEPTREQAKVSSYLIDNGETLPYDVPEREVAPGVRVARSATGGLSIRNGNLREVLAAADTDALTKLKDSD